MFPCHLRQAYVGYPSDPAVPLKSTPQGELEVSREHGAQVLFSVVETEPLGLILWHVARSVRALRVL